MPGLPDPLWGVAASAAVGARMFVAGILDSRIGMMTVHAVPRVVEPPSQ